MLTKTKLNFKSINISMESEDLIGCINLLAPFQCGAVSSRGIRVSNVYNDEANKVVGTND